MPTKKKDRHPEQQGWTQLPGETNLKHALMSIMSAVQDRLARDSGLGIPITLTHSLKGKTGWVSAMGVAHDDTVGPFGLIARVTFDKFGDDISYKIDTEFSGIDTYDVPKDVWNRTRRQDYHHIIVNNYQAVSTLSKRGLWRTEVAYRLENPLEDGCACEIISDAWKMIGMKVRLVSLKDKIVTPLDGQWKDTEIRLGGDMNKTLRRVEENA